MSEGVDELIDRLREEGVAAGRKEAATILAAAHTEARRTLDKANAEARERLANAQKEAEAYQRAGEEALKTAMRDTVLAMKADLMERFSADVERLVSGQLANKDLLQRMILEVAGRATASIEAAGEIELVLPERIIGLDELRSDPDELESGELTHFALGVTGEMLRDGVTLRASDDLASGIEVHVKDQNMVLDLNEKAVAALLLQHLQPRFRAILEGIVR